jgi:hypothetical protein
MHGYETLTAPAETAAPPRVEPHAVRPTVPFQQGDFAAGLRTHPHDAGACGTFATGTSESLTRAARAIGDFASGARSQSGPRAIGDFATGTRARGDGRPRPGAVDRPRSDRERQDRHWAAA